MSAENFSPVQCVKCTNLAAKVIKSITVNKYKMLPYLSADAQNSGSCEVSPQRSHFEHVLAKRAINKCID